MAGKLAGKVAVVTRTSKGIGAAIAMRTFVESVPLASGLVGAGGEITWPRPTRPADTLQVETEVVEMRPSKSNPQRGVVSFKRETKNERGEVVQVLVSNLIVPRGGEARGE